MTPTDSDDTKDDLTREDFRRWGREGGLAGRKTPRRKCKRCGAFLAQSGECKRCKRLAANRHDNPRPRRTDDE
jgi:hypothetical protein